MVDKPTLLGLLPDFLIGPPLSITLCTLLPFLPKHPLLYLRLLHFILSIPLNPLHSWHWKKFTCMLYLYTLPLRPPVLTLILTSLQLKEEEEEKYPSLTCSQGYKERRGSNRRHLLTWLVYKNIWS